MVLPVNLGMVFRLKVPAAKNLSHPRIPAARLLFAILRDFRFSTWGDPEVGGGDNFLGFPGPLPVFFSAFFTFYAPAFFCCFLPPGEVLTSGVGITSWVPRVGPQSTGAPLPFLSGRLVADYATWCCIILRHIIRVIIYSILYCSGQNKGGRGKRGISITKVHCRCSPIGDLSAANSSQSRVANQWPRTHTLFNLTLSCRAELPPNHETRSMCQLKRNRCTCQTTPRHNTQTHTHT